MSIKKIEQLLKKYAEGEITFEEEQELRAYFRRSDVPKELQSQAGPFRDYEAMRQAEPSDTFNPFAKIDFETEASTSSFSTGIPLGEGGKRQRRRGMTERLPISGLDWPGRIAAGFILLIIGFAAGHFLGDPGDASTRQDAPLQQEVKLMKTTLMDEGNAHNASAGERLSAVNISTRLPADDQRLHGQITDILIYTMNNDGSVNVRIAAAEALFRFRKEERIQYALVNALSRQDDPLMQITLIHMLVKLKAKDAINEMQKMLVSSGTQEVVLEQLKAGIAQLKT